MGREVRRVALGFDWPMNKTWHGFLNPYHSAKCPHCDGSGYSPQAKRFQDEWYGNAPFDHVAYGAEPLSIESPKLLAVARWNVERSPEYYGSGDHAVRREVARLHRHFIGQWCHHLIQADVDALCEANRLRDLTSEWTKEKGWVKTGHEPTAAEVNEWSLQGIAHDSINAWVCIKARAKRERVPTTCKVCKGSGEIWQTPELKKLHNKWRPIDPPKGDGWQMWETTSEGSPISPVFDAPEKLGRWLADNSRHGVTKDATYEQWMRMILGSGWAPSGMMVDGQMMSGVAGLAEITK